MIIFSYLFTASQCDDSDQVSRDTDHHEDPAAYRSKRQQCVRVANEQFHCSQSLIRLIFIQPQHTVVSPKSHITDVHKITHFDTNCFTVHSLIASLSYGHYYSNEPLQFVMIIVYCDFP